MVYSSDVGIGFQCLLHAPQPRKARKARLRLVCPKFDKSRWRKREVLPVKIAAQEMAVTTRATKPKRTSRKGKSEWRKNVDMTDIEAALTDARLEERTG